MTTDLTRLVLIAGPPCSLLNNEDHLRSADLDRPLIVVKIRELDGAALIIDGYARPATVH